MISLLKNCFIFLLITNYCIAQSWERIDVVSNIPQSGPLLNGYFNGDTSVIISAGGYIVRSNDFYITYKIDSTFNHTQLTDISFGSTKVGYILAPGEHGGILKSTNSGIDWEPIYESVYTTADWGNRLVFFNPELAICTHYSSNSFYTTIDSGVTWVDNPVSNFGCERIIRSIAVNDSVVYILCTDETSMVPIGNLRILKSINGGQSWNEIEQLGIIGDVDIEHIADSTFLLVKRNLILKSDDEFHSFDTLLSTNSVDNSIGLYSRSVSFLNKDTGYVAFGRSVYKTIDGGLNWIKTDFHFNTGETDNGIVFIKAITYEKIILGCYNGNIYKTETGGGVWTGIDEAMHDSFFHLYPNPVTSQLNCQVANANGQYSVYTIQGSIVTPATTIPGTNFNLDVSTLPSGIYYMAIQDDKQRYIKKFVKQ